MELRENISLREYTSLRLPEKAEYFVEIESKKALIDFLENRKQEDLYVLGGGSNVLFLSDYKGVVLKNTIKGKEVVNETSGAIEIKVCAGENWHKLVLWTLQQDWGGLENLSLIPGSVGASPIQNIGAYGVEVKDCIKEVETVEIATGETKVFSNKDCEFGYRESVFKRELKGQYIVTAVSFRLSKKNHKLITSYGAIKEELAKSKEPETIQAVSRAVIKIRESKLPNPEEIPNTGSFFKNPVVSKARFNSLKLKYENLPNYPINSDLVKIPAGWLIEKTGWKGRKEGNVGVHNKQALIIVNPGGGSGREVYELSQKIINEVKNRFGIELEREVNIID